MKKTKIVVPALAVLLLSTAASVSGTVAWFSMNTSINVTGMTVTTKVSSNLQIAEDNYDTEYSNEDLPQARNGIIEPASTVDGNAFFYTTNADIFGDASADEYLQYSEAAAPEQNPTNALSDAKAAASGHEYFDEQFDETYAIGYDNTDDTTNPAFAYIDYDFYLKATIVGDSQKIVMDKCNLLYNGHSLSTEWAWRVGVFALAVDENEQKTNAQVTGTSTNLISILDLSKSKNQNEIESAVLTAEQATTGYSLDPQLQTPASAAMGDGHTRYYRAKEGETGPKAISGTAVAPTAVNNANEPANITASAVAAGTVRYKVVIRLWLEGEDVSCTSDTFASLTNSWALNLSFKLGAADGVENISSDEPAVNP